MREAPLLIRWGIPGTVFFGAFFFCVIFDLLWSHIHYPDQLHSLIQRMKVTQLFHDYSLVGVVAFLIGASIPVGFMISQLYYFGYWSAFPFRTRRHARKVLSNSEIEQLDSLIELDEQIKREHLDDDGRLRELGVRVMLFLLYLLVAIIIIPINTAVYILSKIYQMISTPIPLLKQLGLQIPWKKYKIIEYEEVRKSHYRWIALMWQCRLRANPDELIRLENLDSIYHGLGSTYIAVLFGWVSFWLLHHHLPTSLPTPDTEVINITGIMMLALFFIFWQNRKDVARHQLTQMKLLLDRPLPQHTGPFSQPHHSKPDPHFKQVTVKGTRKKQSN
jgi:hypothetical protein